MTSGHSHDDRDARSDDRLAQAVRSVHAASLDTLSPRVRAQLAQRRRAALTARASSTTRRWPMLAMGSAAALALAIGLFVLRDTGTPAQGEVAVAPTGVAPVPTPAVPATGTTPIDGIAPAPTVDGPAVASTDANTDTPEPAVDSILDDDALPPELLAAEFSGADDAMGFDALEESPDFYLWLGSDSAQADTSELL